MGRPVVAIVGRPNVGKSTLFNRIVGRRQAVVDDVPGVTRDRVMGEAEWAGERFLVVDTGGLLPEATRGMDAQVKRQVEAALDLSAAILFVVDVETGLTALDEQIARVVRESGRQADHLSGAAPPRNRALNVTACKQTGDGDAVPQELVLDHHQVHAARMAGKHPAHELGLDDRCRHHSGHHRRAPAAHPLRDGQLVTLRSQPVDEPPGEADPVLELREVLIVGRLRDGGSGQEVPLIGEMDEVVAEASPIAAGESLHLLEDHAGDLGGHRGQERQPFPVAGEPQGDDGHRGDSWMESRQSLRGLFEYRSVVPARAQHHLGVDPGPALDQAAEPGHDVGRWARLVDAEQARPHDRIRGMHRDVERAQTLSEDAVELPRAEVGQGDVVAVQEGEPVVLVAHVQTAPVPLGHLIDEAEDALVAADPRLHLFGLEAEGLPGSALDANLFRAIAAGTLDDEGELFLRPLEAQVDDVAERNPVQGDDAIAGGEPRTCGGAAGLDRGDG